MLGQAIDLVDAKDGIGFEEGDISFDFVAVSVRFGLAGAARIHDCAAGLTLADIRAEFAGLLERPPDRRTEAACYGF